MALPIIRWLRYALTKKLSAVILTVACLLSTAAIEAAPKVTLKVTPPKGTAGEDKVVTNIFNNLPWLPCTDAPIKIGGATATQNSDRLQFDIDVKDAEKSDLYVFFINYSLGKFYALVPSKNYPITTGAELKVFEHHSTEIIGGLGYNNKPSDYRFIDHNDFIAGKFTSTLFGSAIMLDKSNLAQGMWSLLAILVDPAIVKPDESSLLNSRNFQDPKNWQSWSVAPFILGTPFATNVGTTGNGLCQ